MWIKGNKDSGEFNQIKKNVERKPSAYPPLIKIQYAAIFLRYIVEKWARRLTAFTEGKSKRTLIWYLVFFNVLFLVALSYQIGSVFNLRKSDHQIIPMEKGVSKQLMKQSLPTISEYPKGKEEEQIENYVLYLDFLKKDSIAKNRSDSSTNSRPEILDSLMLIQKDYQLKFKK